MSPTPKKLDPAGGRPLPTVNVEYAAAGDQGQMTPQKVRGMIANPVYTGMGPYPAIMDDEEWIRAAPRMIKREGAEQFLVNMLYVLRKALGPGTPESGEE